jgi:Flp pilus assembly pilin Flp
MKSVITRKLWSDERGDTGFVEWLLLVGLIAIAGFVAFSTVGKNVSQKADEAGKKVLELDMSSGTPK